MRTCVRVRACACGPACTCHDAIHIDTVSLRTVATRFALVVCAITRYNDPSARFGDYFMETDTI